MSLQKAQSLYKFYKSIHKSNIFENNTMVIGTSSKYRAMEESDDLIGDKDEEYNVRNSGVLDVDLSKKERPINFPSHMFDGNMKLHFYNSIFRESQPDSYIFCYSNGILEDLADDICHKPPGNYDSAYQILDINLFKHAWKNATFNDNRGINPFRTIAGNPIVGPVHYSDEIKLLTDPTSSFDPFRKRAKYSSQQECRAIFNMKKQEGREQVLIYIPNLSSYIKDVDMPVRQNRTEAT